MRVLIFVSICQFQTIDDVIDLNHLRINCTEKLSTPVLTTVISKFALKYETMALSCNRDFLTRLRFSQKIVKHANENTLKTAENR